MRIEMHIHTSNVSPCARVPAPEAARIHAKAGMDAVVVTEHFNDYVLESFPGSPREKVDRYLDGYRAVQEEGARLGLTVILGMESRILGGSEDFLIYGIDPDFLYANPTFYHYTQKEAFDACCEYGALLLQAHPFRTGCHPRDPKFLHGIEIYNGHPRHDNNNDQAEAWANEHGLRLRTSGSDFHQVQDCGTGGILIDGTVSNSKELASWLLNKPFTLIKSKATAPSL